MPLARITVQKGRSAGERRAILDGVHAALVEAFQIPERDRHQQLHELEPGNFEPPPGRTAAYTLVEITAFPGRSAEAKKKLFRAVVENLSRAPGIAPEDVFIVIHEPPLENWGIRGGKPASEVEIGFKLDV